jgi:hypothetical protein
MASLSAFFYYYGHNQVLLYGDAVAHINIARRAFDSRTPGPLQLGTVWLPLPHLLIMPFVVSDWAWRTGILASLPFMAAYVAAVAGMFRLVRGGLGLAESGAPASQQNMAAGFAAAVLAANPNLLYMQATAMTESLYLGLFIWTVVLLGEHRRELRAGRYGPAAGRILAGACCLAGAMLTRYDGWFAAPFVLLLLLAAFRGSPARRRAGDGEPRPAENPWNRVAAAIVVILAVPALWLAYNAIVFGNPFDFATGPYSARGIAQRTSASGQFHYPGYHNLYASALYFAKAAELNLANGWWGKLWLIMAAAGTVFVLARARQLGAGLLLWLPLPFYVVSMAYGGVPIFVPEWWPHSYYNVRYGLELLPAASAFAGIALFMALAWARAARWRMVLPAAIVTFAALSYAGLWRSQPICLREAVANARTRVPFETELAKQLDRLPSRSTILMYIGDHVGALQRAGIPLRRVIHEGNHGDWKHALARTGMWEDALAQPGRMADYAVAFDDDPVARSARAHGLPSVVVVETLGQPRAVIYQTHPGAR